MYNLVTLGLASFILRTLYRCPVVYDIQDLWPDSVMHSGMMKQSILQGVLNTWCQFIYRKASHLTTLSPGFKAELIKRGVPEENVSVVYNWCDEKHLSMSDKDDAIISEIRGKESFVVLFAGTMGIMQGLDAVLDSARMLMKIEPKVKFVFVGGGIEKKSWSRVLSKDLLWERMAESIMMKSYPCKPALAALKIYFTGCWENEEKAF